MQPSGAAGTWQQWLRRAQSNLIRAKQEKPDGVLWEDVCFDAQQACEKALKALLVYRGVPFRRVHDLAELLTIIQGSGIVLPPHVQTAAGLTVYAVEMRYPGSYPPVTDTEAREAVEQAEALVEWVKGLLPL